MRRPWRRAGGGDDDRRTKAARAVLEWADRPFVPDCENRSVHHVLDATAALSAFVLDRPHEPHLETLRANLAAVDSLSIYDRRDRSLGEVVEAVAAADVDGVHAACEALDEYYGGLDSYETSVTEVVNLDTTFAVAFAREHGLDVRYAGEFVPAAVVEDYPL